ncbi:YheC/YheD family endospore coat-associated protein [Paenibacillus sp. y28]|uniref:YheC/YheD family endospore coat-associated protein n=1 Tax=Paenibacillus sp. y28 TaxID=3129110 RepID=UPI00301647B3
MRALAAPTLGVISLYSGDHSRKICSEELSYFKKLVLQGHALGLNVIVFTPQDVDDAGRRVYAFLYQQSTGRWIRSWQPLPPLIYDRCRFQASRRFQQFKRFREKYASQLTFLNRPLANKWTINGVLARNSSIRPHLPQTTRYTPLALQKMIRSTSLVYVKPINGTGGRGILRLEKLDNGQIVVQGRNRQRRIIPEQRLERAKLPTRLAALGVGGDYLVQQGIRLRLPNGRVHDFRLLIQKNGQGQWEITGCAGRIGPPSSITSNLHGGGQAISMDALLRRRFSSEAKVDSIRQAMYQLSRNIAAYLEEQYGKLCELGLDIAVDPGGHPWLLEINPKPAREVFTRIKEHQTYRNAIRRPLEYALWLHRQGRQPEQSAAAQ